jgi:hypothetical protein
MRANEGPVVFQVAAGYLSRPRFELLSSKVGVRMHDS